MIATGNVKVECPICQVQVGIPIRVASMKGATITLAADPKPIREHLKAHTKLEPTK